MSTVMLGLNEEPMIFFLLVAVAGVLIYTIRTIRDMRMARDREQTKRELAAYVAEGSIRPEDATAILNAGVPHSTPAELEIAHGVESGAIDPEKAASLIHALRHTPAQNSPR